MHEESNAHKFVLNKTCECKDQASHEKFRFEQQKCVHLCAQKWAPVFAMPIDSVPTYASAMSVQLCVIAVNQTMHAHVKSSYRNCPKMYTTFSFDQFKIHRNIQKHSLNTLNNEEI